VTLREARKLTVGDTFKRPSTNGHDNGWRSYEVTGVDMTGIQLADMHGYSSVLPWFGSRAAINGVKQFFANAVAVKVQQ
jgi:hypothetical protein